MTKIKFKILDPLPVPRFTIIRNDKGEIIGTEQAFEMTREEFKKQFPQSRKYKND